ncbi:MAG: glycosyltransferase, partial [Planctomycetes bacterium]|nr:glycosyltransferase [Planctomycetota bacterium]
MSTIGVVAPYDLANIYSGSVQRIKSDLIALSSSGFNVEVLFPSSTNRWLWEPLDSQELPIQLVPLPYPGIQKVPFFPQKAKLIFDAHTQFINPFCRFKLRRHASKYRVVFAHFPASFVASWFALSKKTVPIIYVAHDCEYSLIKQSTRNPLIHALMYRFERFACSKASKILCVSELDMHELQYTYDIPSEKMAVLPNTVDTHSLSETLAVYDKAEERHNLGISASSFVLLFHGRMDYRPNMDALRFILDE